MNIVLAKLLPTLCVCASNWDLSQVSMHLHERELTVLLNVEPGLVDDDAAVGGEDLHGDPQRPDEDEEPDGEAARRHQQRPLVQVEAETAPPKHRCAAFPSSSPDSMLSSM